MTVLCTFLETSLNFLFNGSHKKTVQNYVQSGKKVVSKFELPKTQFDSIVRDKIDSKTRLE